MCIFKLHPLRKNFIYCGEEFGLEHADNVALIRRALYGGKAAGRDFWNHLGSCMEHIHFKSIRDDPDVWILPERIKDGTKYY